MKLQTFILSFVISIWSGTLVAQQNPASAGTADLTQKRGVEPTAFNSEAGEAAAQKQQAGQKFDDFLRQDADARARDQAQAGEEYKRATAHFQERLQGVIRRAPGAGRSLVIRSSEIDRNEQVNLEEDLKVMSRVLEKTLGGAVGPQQQGNSVLGIDVFFGPGSNPIRGLYLDGYGALFTLNVGFPLVPPAKNDDEKEKPQTDSVWDEARQEVYGQRMEYKAVYVRGQEYDERKVSRLKDAVLDALKNATHIRGLKGDDSVTVCIFGGQSVVVKDSPEHIRQELMDLRKQESELQTQYTDKHPRVLDLRNKIQALESQLATKQPSGTMLTIRIKKSDVDAFAQDKLSLEELRKKAKIVSYAGGPESADGVTVFGGGGTGGGGFGGGSGF